MSFSQLTGQVTRYGAGVQHKRCLEACTVGVHNGVHDVKGDQALGAQWGHIYLCSCTNSVGARCVDVNTA